MFRDQAHRAFEQNASGLSIFISLDRTILWIRCRLVDARFLKCIRIHPCCVKRFGREIYGMVWSRCIKLGECPKISPSILIPPVAKDPRILRGVSRLQVDEGQAGGGGWLFTIDHGEPASIFCKMNVSINQARDNSLAAEIDR